MSKTNRLKDNEIVKFATDFITAYQSSNTFRVAHDDGLVFIEVHDDHQYTVAIGYNSVTIHKASIDELLADRIEGEDTLRCDSAVEHIELE